MSTKDKPPLACEFCLFWSQLGNGQGLCRRHPPALLPGIVPGIGYWPETDGMDWCGEYEPHIRGEVRDIGSKGS